MRQETAQWREMQNSDERKKQEEICFLPGLFRTIESKEEMKEFLKVWWHGSMDISWAKFSDYRADRMKRCGFNYYVLQVGHIYIMVS